MPGKVGAKGGECGFKDGGVAETEEVFVAFAVDEAVVFGVGFEVFVGWDEAFEGVAGVSGHVVVEMVGGFVRPSECAAVEPEPLRPLPVAEDVGRVDVPVEEGGGG